MVAKAAAGYPAPPAILECIIAVRVCPPCLVASVTLLRRAQGVKRGHAEGSKLEVPPRAGRRV